jgi:hypothetical protein
MPMYEKTLAEAGENHVQMQITGGLAVEHRPSVTELLTLERHRLMARLAQVNQALLLAEENKGTMNLIDAIARSGVSSRL